MDHWKRDGRGGGKNQQKLIQGRKKRNCARKEEEKSTGHPLHILHPQHFSKGPTYQPEFLFIAFLPFPIVVNRCNRGQPALDSQLKLYNNTHAKPSTDSVPALRYSDEVKKNKSLSHIRITSTAAARPLVPIPLILFVLLIYLTITRYI